MVIHSFDEVLRQPKMLHSIEVTPGGQTKFALWKPVSWIAVSYFGVAFLALLIFSKTAPGDMLVSFLSPLVYFIVLPGGIVWLILYSEMDGRAPHVWFWAYVRYFLRPKRTVGGRPAPLPGTKTIYTGKIRISWDLNAPRLKHGWVKGGTVSTSVPVRFTHALRHRHRVMRPSDSDNVLTDYEVAGRMEIKP